jgi:thioredoxin reductase (NADPH)
MSIENVIIVGSGPAGYTAALYTARADLRPLVIEGYAWGGLLQQTTEVENFPGYPDGVLGPDMIVDLRRQAQRFGARLLTEQATAVDLADAVGATHTVWVGDEAHRTRAVILAMGAEHRKLGASGEADLTGRGVSYCATCDAAFFRDRPVVVIGGGDSAMEEAAFLTRFAATVTVIHRRNEFRASRIMLERVRSLPGVRFRTPYAVQNFLARDGRLAAVELRQTATNDRYDLDADGAFITIGHQPQSALVASSLALDDAGYIQVHARSTRTDRPGVFGAGDLIDPHYRQAITAAGTGCQAALDAEHYLRDTTPVYRPSRRR